MPHQPRPVSPVAFESCTVPVDNSESSAYELLGSDDELDDVSRARKRQRIEKLADSYLRGGSLFISTARLRGPFDDGWNNPWKKERKTVSKSDSWPSKISGLVNKTASACVQESNPEHKISKVQPVIARPASAFIRETVSPQIRPVAQNNSPVFEKSPSNTRNSPQLPRRSKEVSSPAHQHTIIEAGSIDWLRKDRKRMNFKSFEPPTSPTPTNGHRRMADHQVGGNVSRSDAPVGSRGSPAKAIPHNLSMTDNSPTKSAPDATIQPHVTPSTSKITSQSPVLARNSPVAPAHSPERNEQHASFRVVSSTSQLSRFEYRRLRVPESRRSSSLKSSTWGKATANSSPTMHPYTEANTAKPANETDNPAVMEQFDQVEPAVATEAHAMEVDGEHQSPNHSPHLSKSLRFAYNMEEAGSTGMEMHPPTEKSTYEEVASAQEVPPPPNVSDRVPSLHSTAMPKETSNISADTSPNVDLSTQAALLLAQKSFQDDLESPAHEYGITPAQQRGMIDIEDESLLAHETPLFRPDTSERTRRRSLRISDKNIGQAASTQCMLDAATPYTFSTGKKPRAFRSISPQKNDSIKPRAIHTAQRPESSSPLPEGDSASQFGDGSSPVHVSSDHHAADHTYTHRSTTQTTSLPFALSGSTPTTAQDGQGGLQTGDSFDLSQAIADAGSWLQQSFDFMKSTRGSPQNAQAPPETVPPGL